MKKMLKEQKATERENWRSTRSNREKHTEIHKARNEQRALRVTEFNGTETWWGMVGGNAATTKRNKQKTHPVPSSVSCESRGKNTTNCQRKSQTTFPALQRAHETTPNNERTVDGNRQRDENKACHEKFSKLTNFEIYTLRKWIKPVRGNLQSRALLIYDYCASVLEKRPEFSEMTCGKLYYYILIGYLTLS